MRCKYVRILCLHVRASRAAESRQKMRSLFILGLAARTRDLRRSEEEPSPPGLIGVLSICVNMWTRMR